MSDAASTLVIRLDRAVLEIVGPEAAGYLQGQISQEVEALEPGVSRMSFVLDPRGRVESLFRLTRLSADRFLADTEPGNGEALKQSLERFKLGTQADFKLTEQQMLVVRGDCDRSQAQGLVLESLWPAAVPAGFDVLGEAPTLESASIGGVVGGVVGGVTDGVANDVVGDVTCDIAVFEWLRALSGLPVIGREIKSGAIPNETGLLDVAVNFNKGCYRGQELVERIDSRAGGRRELRRVQATAELTAGEPVLDANSAEVGTVLTVAHRSSTIGESDEKIVCAGFAMLRADTVSSPVDAASELYVESGRVHSASILP